MSLLVGFQHKKEEGGEGGQAYIQKGTFVAEMAILAKKKFAEKVRKSRQKCVNGANRQKMVKIDRK